MAELGEGGSLALPSSFAAHAGPPDGDLAARATALEQRLRLAVSQCRQPPLQRLMAAWGAARSCGHAPGGFQSSPEVLPDRVVDDAVRVRAAGPADGETAFGGPWLPREVLEPSWPRKGQEVAVEARPALLRDEVGSCRRDRRRYFEQYLACRHHLLSQRAPHHSASSAPATARAPRSDEGAPLRPSMAPGKRSGSRRPPSARGRWERFWQDLAGAESRPRAPERALPQYLEARELLERRLCLWERETLGLLAQSSALKAEVRQLEAVVAARRVLDDATEDLVATLPPTEGPRGR